MGKFNAYNISLKGNQADVRTFEFHLDNEFFKNIDGNEVQKGKISVDLTVKKSAYTYEFKFVINGVAFVPCDRCLDDVEIPIETEEKLFVKLGKEYSEESDNLIVIPEDEGEINVAWFLYEFIALAIPMKHVHAPGKCNKTMSSKLKKHSAKSSDDDEDGVEYEGGEVETEDSTIETDPRWDELKKFMDNN